VTSVKIYLQPYIYMYIYVGLVEFLYGYSERAFLNL